MNNPLVTVYIPTYNRIELLKRAVDSVRQQTYKNIEVIIVDDCSTDETHRYLEEISNEDARIRYFLKKKNSGACASRNIAIESAKGKFITGLDDDDFFENNRIEEFLKKWKRKSKNTKMLYSLYSRKTYEFPFKQKNIKKRLMLKNKINANDLIYFFYTGNQIFVESSFFKKNLFDENMPAWQDFECFYRFLKKYNCYAELVEVESYVVDISHDHERISTKNIENIKHAFNIFRNKYELSEKENNLLRCHLYNYPNIKLNKIDIFKRFLYRPSILDIKRLIGFKVVK